VQLDRIAPDLHEDFLKDVLGRGGIAQDPEGDGVNDLGIAVVQSEAMACSPPDWTRARRDASSSVVGCGVPATWTSLSIERAQWVVWIGTARDCCCGGNLVQTEVPFEDQAEETRQEAKANDSELRRFFTAKDRQKMILTACDSSLLYPDLRAGGDTLER
jgi:hypothetical protein